MAKQSKTSRIDAGDRDTIEAIRLAEPVAGGSPAISGSAADSTVERRRGLNRRQDILRAFVYGNFRPRRRSSRRTADEHRYGYDWHEPRILYLTICVLLLCCADALFTLKLLGAGASEANAVMARMLEESVETFLASKIGITALSLIILVAAARRKFFGSVGIDHLLQASCVGYILVIYYQIYLFWYVFELDIF